jgi:DNA-binding XRE family transcriptional regulator
MKNNSATFNKVWRKVREIRTQKGLSQEQLAHIANVHRTYMGDRKEEKI